MQILTIDDVVNGSERYRAPISLAPIRSIRFRVSSSAYHPPAKVN
ncbi:hypothetical protein Hdeb2414_s0007g00261331 [Helianthus debilis subsp. tardiflorus]